MSAVFIVSYIPDSKNRTRHQHAMALAERYNLTIVTNAGVNEEVEQQSDHVYAFSDCSLSQFQFLFPFWLLYAIIRADSDIIISEQRGYSLFIAWVTCVMSNQYFIADVWDDPRLPVESYLNSVRLGTLHALVYYGVSYLLAKQILRRARLVITSIHPDLLSKYNIPEYKQCHLTNGILRSMRDTIEPVNRSGGISIIYVGHINKKRGTGRFVNQLQQLSFKKEVTLHLVGKITSEVQEQIEASKSEISVEIHGHCSHEEALTLVAGADIALCLLSKNVDNYRYSYPIKLFEYGLFGKPTIASDFRGIRDVIKDGESGILVDPANKRDLQRGVVRLVSDEQLRKRLGQNLCKRIDNFYWEDIREDYIRAIEDTYLSELD
jgi:glycosyltransferase involved in cell wall biosynthesis